MVRTLKVGDSSLLFIVQGPGCRDQASSTRETRRWYGTPVKEFVQTIDHEKICEMMRPQKRGGGHQTNFSL